MPEWLERKTALAMKKSKILTAGAAAEPSLTPSAPRIEFRGPGNRMPRVEGVMDFIEAGLILPVQDAIRIKLRMAVDSAVRRSQ